MSEVHRIVLENDSAPDDRLAIEVDIARRLGGFALTCREAESLREQLNTWHATQIWPDTPQPTEARHAGAAIAARIWCPQCKQLHVDRGVWATKPHSTHLCEHCGALWRTPTVGIEGGATLLFEMDDGGSKHYISAHSAERARQLFVDSIGEEPEEWKTESPELTEVTREAMRTMKFTFEDGTTTSMENVFDLLDHEECLVATTEV